MNWVFETIERVARDKWYVVGGYVRDFFVGKETKDVDIITKEDSYQIGKRIASEINADAIVVLDKKLKVIRIVKGDIIIDISSIEGESVEEDLKKRDFTVNAIAFSPMERKWIDPFCGIKDIKERKLKEVDKNNLLRDPVRLLRAIRFAACLNLNIQKGLLSFIKENATELKKTAPERIMYELLKILEVSPSYPYILLLKKTKLLFVIFPFFEKLQRTIQWQPTNFDTLTHSLLTLYWFEKILIKLKELFKNYTSQIEEYLREKINGWDRLVILKLGMILHDVGKYKKIQKKDNRIVFYGHPQEGSNIIQRWSEDMRLPGRWIKILKKLILLHMRVGYLTDLQNITEKAALRIIREAEEESIGLLLLSYSDLWATPYFKNKHKKHKQTIDFILDLYFHYHRLLNAPKIIDGYDLMKEFNLKPSPIIGKILKKIQQEIVLGKVKTKQDAFLIAKKILKEDGHKI